VPNYLLSPQKAEGSNGAALDGLRPLDAPVDPPKESEKEERPLGFGIPQFAVGALSLLLVGIFVITSGPGGGGAAPRPL
jgi:hypothetical protein